MRWRILLAFLLPAISGCGSNPVLPDDTVLDFPPAVMNTPEWAQLSVAEQQALLQVPEPVLASVPTGVLVEAYYRIPGHWNGWDMPYYQYRYDSLAASYGITGEILQRKDALDALLQFYRTLRHDPAMEDPVPSVRRAHMGTFKCIEILLAQYEILDRLNDVEIRRVMAASIRTFHLKDDLSVNANRTDELGLTIFPVVRLIEKLRLEVPAFSEALNQIDPRYIIRHIDIGVGAPYWIIIPAAESYVPDWEELAP